MAGTACGARVPPLHVSLTTDPQNGRLPPRCDRVILASLVGHRVFILLVFILFIKEGGVAGSMCLVSGFGPDKSASIPGVMFQVVERSRVWGH